MALAEKRFELLNSYDVVQARQYARQIARELGFSLTDQTRIATAISEVARQALDDEGRGEIAFTTLLTANREGLECTCLGGGSLLVFGRRAGGKVLGGVERLMDEFELEPGAGGQIAIVMRKWLQKPGTEGSPVQKALL